MAIKKGEIISQLNARGVTDFAGQPLEELSLTELRELLTQEVNSDKDEIGKIQKNPMAGMERLKRGQLDKIAENLTNQPAKSLRNKGAVLMVIRKGLAELQEKKIEIGKNKGTPFRSLLENPGYVAWMKVETAGQCDPRLKQMYQYCRLMLGEDKREAKEKGETEDSDWENPPKVTPLFPDSEPLMLNKDPLKKETLKQELKTELKKEVKVEMKQEARTTPGTSSQNQPPADQARIPPATMPPKPEWTGNVEDWESYASACQQWAVRMQELGFNETMSNSEKRRK